MNGPEQVARFSATQRLEARLENLETVVDAQTALIVKQREAFATDLQVFNERLRVYAELEAERLNRADRQQECAFATFKFMGFWQRVRWFVRGV